MPTRGYRKGTSDTKTPIPVQTYTRVSSKTHAALKAEAASRSMTVSALVRELLAAYVDQTRLTLPQARGPSAEALRELRRVGNNINQLAHQANLTRLPLIEARVRAALADFRKVIERL